MEVTNQFADQILQQQVNLFQDSINRDLDSHARVLGQKYNFDFHQGCPFEPPSGKRFKWSEVTTDSTKPQVRLTLEKPDKSTDQQLVDLQPSPELPFEIHAQSSQTQTFDMKQDPFGLKKSDNRPSIFSSSISRSTAFGSSLTGSDLSTARDIFQQGSVLFGSSIFGGSNASKFSNNPCEQNLEQEDLEEREDLEWAEDQEGKCNRPAPLLTLNRVKLEKSGSDGSQESTSKPKNKLLLSRNERNYMNQNEAHNPFVEIESKLKVARQERAILSEESDSGEGDSDEEEEAIAKSPIQFTANSSVKPTNSNSKSLPEK